MVAEQNGSGQCVATFCRERGVPASQLFAWKRRLRQAAAEPFVEVKLGSPAAWGPPAQSRAIEIRLRRGLCLMVEPGFDAEHLRAVVVALETR